MRCKYDVSHGYHFRQCSKNAVQDGFCTVHHPDTKKARQEKRDKKFLEEQQKRQAPYEEIRRLKKEIRKLKRELSEIMCTSEDRAESVACLKNHFDQLRNYKKYTEAYKAWNFLILHPSQKE